MITLIYIACVALWVLSDVPTIQIIAQIIICIMIDLIISFNN